jgi:uncharacterized DUF497 family protein
VYIHICHYAECRGISLGRTKEPGQQQKHGISFETAMLVFDDPYHLTSQDLEVDGEPRWQTIGMVNGIQMILVAHTVDEDDDLVRILSARKATPRERNIYGQGT